MSYEELTKRRSIVLNETDGFRYIMYPVTQEEGEQIYELYTKKEIDYSEQVHLIAKLDDVIASFIKHLIPVSKVHKIRYVYASITHFEEVQEFKCYQDYNSKKENNVIIHEDRYSSLKCACQQIMSDTFIVLKQPYGDNQS